MVFAINRESQLKRLAEKLWKLEKENNIVLISSNGFTDAVIVDKTTGKGYEYHRNQGKISSCSDEINQD